MAIELNRIYHEKNLDTMARMDNDSVHLIVTSPPYAEARKHTYGGIHPDKFIEWFLPLAREMLRILHPKGSLILNVGDNTINGETHLWTYELPGVMKHAVGFKFIDALIWHKKTCPPGKFNNRFKDGWEFCYHFAKNTEITFNPYAVAQKMKESTYQRAAVHKNHHATRPATDSGFTLTNKAMHNALTKTGSGFQSNINGVQEDKRRMRNNGSGFGTSLDTIYDKGLALPSNVLHLSPETRNQGHSAVFPVELPTFFIAAYSNEGDIVYDPFCGSGTTGEASLMMRRKFIGSETKLKNVNLANSRIHKWKNSLFS